MAGRLWTCGVIRAEVIRGIRAARIKADLNDLFDLIPEVPTDTELWRATPDLAWKLDRRGSVLPLTDLIVAACAFHVDTTVVTLDAHFAVVPGLKTGGALP